MNSDMAILNRLDDAQHIFSDDSVQAGDRSFLVSSAEVGTAHWPKAPAYYDIAGFGPSPIDRSDR